MVLCFGSLEMLSKRRDPKQSWVDSLKSQRRGSLGDRFRMLAWDKLPLPVAPLVVSLVGTLRI